MNNIILPLLAAAAIQTGTAQEVEIWAGAQRSDVVLAADNSYTETYDNGVRIVHDKSVPTLEKFTPCLPTKRDKVIIICPGGAYSGLADNIEGTEIAQWLTQQGYTAYVLRYRVPDCRDGALQDAQRAIRLVRAANPGLKVGIMGFSAGASLSARAATSFDRATYTAVDDTDRLSARPDFVSLIYPAYMDLGENRTLSPELTITDKTPPFFVFQTEEDHCGNSALVITQALRDHKIPVELHFYPDGAHGYGLRAYFAEVASIWPRLMETWLEKQ